MVKPAESMIDCRREGMDGWMDGVLKAYSVEPVSYRESVVVAVCLDGCTEGYKNKISPLAEPRRDYIFRRSTCIEVLVCDRKLIYPLDYLVMP